MEDYGRDILIALESLAKEVKRIADKLDKGVFDPLAPVNQYGEGLSEAIQSSIVRGFNRIEY